MCILLLIKVLSLYSTRTQIRSRWAVELGMTANTTILRYRYQLVGIRKALWTQREPAEYSSRWVREGWVCVCVGHVDFVLFVLFLFALATQCVPTRTHFLVEYEYELYMFKKEHAPWVQGAPLISDSEIAVQTRIMRQGSPRV